MSPNTATKALSWLLILLGGLAMLAVVPMVMPTAWMEAVNDSMGLGPFHRSPLMEYLTRSLSAAYAVIGTIIFYLGLNVRRYLPLIVIVGWLTVALGAALTGIDFAVGMPATWSWGEGPPTIVIGWVFVWLARRAANVQGETPPPRRFRSIPVLGLLLLVVHPPVGGDDEWPHWRGPDQDGRASDTGVFGETFGLERAWTVPLGFAYSGIVVSDGRLVTMFSDGQTNWLTALDAGTGREIWRYEIDAAYKGRQSAEDGPRSTPLIEDGVVYGLGPRGQLLAVDLSDGHPLWRTDLRSRFGSMPPAHGFTTSSVIEGDVLVVLVGGSRKRSIAGIDKKTGDTLWTNLSYKVEYQSPVLMTLAGRRQIVIADRNHVTGLIPENGEVLWTRDIRGIGSGHGPQASYLGGNRFLIKFFESIAVFELKKATDGYETQMLYRVDEFKKSYLPPIFHDGYLYGFNAEFLTCVNGETGEQIWKSRPPQGKGMILVDGHLVILANEGFVVVVQATPEGYREKARVQVLERDGLTWPSFADGKVFVRNMEQIGAASIRGTSNKDP